MLNQIITEKRTDYGSSVLHARKLTNPSMCQIVLIENY